MKLYERDGEPSQPWLDRHQTCEIAPTWEKVIEIELAHIGLIHAPKAERAVKAWKKVRAALSSNETAEELRTYLGQVTANKKWTLPAYIAIAMRAVADALEEAEGEDTD